MTIKAIAFDLDGTLAHYTGDFLNLMDAGRKALNMQDICSLEDFYQCYTFYERQDDATTVKVITQQVLKHFGVLEPPNLESLCHAHIARYCADMQLMEGALALLNYFSYLPLALISNAPSDGQRAVIDSLGIAHYFQAICISGDKDICCRKPKRAIFDHLASRLGIDNSNILVIGDSYEADIQGALAAGMQALHRKNT